MSFVISAKFNWTTEDGEALVKNSYVTNIGIIGLGIGSLLGSKVIQVVQEREIMSLMKLLVCVNLFGIIANLTKIVMVYPLILLGRLLSGLAAGISQVMLFKFITETVPSETLQIYGQAINASICFGIAFSSLISIILLPPPEAGEDEFKND